MLIQLLGLAVALTMTATASAKAVSHDQPDGLACETSLRTEPKRAYYNPENTYDYAQNTLYNYSSKTLQVARSSGTIPSSYQSVAPNEFKTISSYNGAIWFVKTSEDADFTICASRNGTLGIWSNPSNSYVHYTPDTYKQLQNSNYPDTAFYYFDPKPITITATENFTLYSGYHGSSVTTYTTGANETGYTLNNNSLVENPYLAEIYGNPNEGYQAKLPQNVTYAGDGSWYGPNVTTNKYAITEYSENITLSVMTEQDYNEAEIGGIFTEVGNVVTGMTDTLTKPWEGIVNIFYDTTNEEVTPMGMVSLIVLGTSVVIMLFAIAIRLFRQRG